MNKEMALFIKNMKRIWKERYSLMLIGLRGVFLTQRFMISGVMIIYSFNVLRGNNRMRWKVKKVNCENIMI